VICPELYKKKKALLYEEIIDSSIKWGQGILTDGSPAGWTVDLRETILTPSYGEMLSYLFMEWVYMYRPDYVAGMTVAAGCLVSQIVLRSQLMAIPVRGLYIRPEPKADGMQKQIEGSLEEGKRVLLIDDLLHSAEISALKCVKILLEHRCIPVALAVILDFERSGQKDMENLGIPVHSIFTLKDLNMTPPSPPADNNLYLPWWKAGSVNSGVYYAPKSGPVAGEGRIFLGSDRGRFLALCPDGDLDWSFPVGETYRGIQTTPVYRNGCVYFGAYDGWTYCLKAKDGTLVWKQKWGDWVGCSSPLYAPGRDIFFTGVEYGKSGGDMISFSGTDGTLLWRFKTEEYVTCAPGLDMKSGTVFAGSLDNTLYALDIDRGEEKWRFITGGNIKGGIACDSETGCCYFTSYDGFFYCLSVKTGMPVWKRKLGRWLYSSPSLQGKYAVVTSEADHVFCLDKYTGKILWKRCLSSVWRMSGYPVIKYDRVYVGSAGGGIFVLSLKDGSILWFFQTGGPVMAPVGVFSTSKVPAGRSLLKPEGLKENSFNSIKDRLYYPGDSGLTHVFNSSATELIWSFYRFHKDKNPPPHRSVMIASSNDGYVYCFLEQTGKYYENTY